MSNILTNNINPRSGNLITIGGANDRVSIAGTLSYEDVANIDSVGIITAQAGIRIPSGSLAIGTSSPATGLHLEGVTDASSSALRITATGACSTGISCNSTGTVIGTDTGGILFKTGVSANTPNTTGTERIRIDSSGRLLVGTATARTNIKFKTNAVNAFVQQETSGSQYSGQSLISYSAGDYNPVLTLGISNSNTLGTNTLVGANWDLGMLQFVGNDGTDFKSAAVIEASVEGTPASGSMPALLRFSTSASGSVVPTERMRITSAGNVGINETNPGGLLQVGSSSASHIIITANTGIDINDGAINLYQATSNVNATPFIISTDVGGTETEKLRIASAGQIGLAGANYGTAGQVIKSTGTTSAPTWQNLHSFMFYGEQDTQQNVTHATLASLINLGTRDFSIGGASIAVFNESSGTLTIGADGAGYYYLEMHCGIDDIQSQDYVQAVIGKNGTASDDGTRISSQGRGWNSTAGNQVVTASTSCIALLSANDVVRFYVFHNEGSTEPTEPNRCSVMGYKLS